jgi:hypothetical protein
MPTWLLPAITTGVQLFLGKKQYDLTKEQGKQTQEQYDQAAADALLQGRSAAISYRQQGADILNNLNKVLATTAARAAASGIEATTGNPFAVAEQSTRDAVMEYYIARDNATLEYAGAGAQARLFAEAGVDARKGYRDSALINAGFNLLDIAQNNPFKFTKPAQLSALNVSAQRMTPSGQIIGTRSTT